MRHSLYVIGFPYAPGINFMTNRRTYLKYHHADNNAQSLTWDPDTMRGIEAHRPALIVINQ
jgi:hypothetical protein